MGETSNCCRKWEEAIYWTHFQCKQFAQFLLGDFHHQLEIPKKFANNMKKKLPETVVLSGPSGSTWNVDVTTKDDTLFFKDGWQEFVKDHSLEENDVLVFRYNGDSRFDVLVFDRSNLCEKEASYFVKKCGDEKPEGGRPTKRKVSEGSVEVIHTFSQDGVGCTSLDKSTSSDSQIIPLGQHVNSQDSDKRIPTETHVINPHSTMSYPNKGSSTLELEVKVETETHLINPDSTMSSPNKGSSTLELEVKVETGAEPKSKVYCLQYASNRRPVTETEKKKVMQLALQASTEDSCMVVMRPSHVYRKFNVGIPAKWVAQHLSPQNQNLILRIKEKTWRARFNYNKVYGGGKLISGFKEFAVDNTLEEFDVCMFQPGNRTNYCTVVMDVSIFRVVQEVTLPSQEKYPSKMSPKKKQQKI